MYLGYNGYWYGWEIWLQLKRKSIAISRMDVAGWALQVDYPSMVEVRKLQSGPISLKMVGHV